MTAWNDGYISDIPYTGGFYREQTPAHLDAACAISGIEPPVGPEASFNYCDLGCGLGETAMVIAASNRRGQVWGIDFNPSHIAHARAVATRAGLDNAHFVERSFEEIATNGGADLPDFDYVTLHGVWSWISRASQAHIVAFLRRRLRPGGVVCISYNALPGWAGGIGLQRLLYETGRTAGGSSDRRIREAVALARRFADTGSPYFDRGTLERVEDAIERGHADYASHEYLNEHWRPVFFADVAAALAPAKLDFVCSAKFTENHPKLCMKADELALVESLPLEQRQTYQDFFYRRIFRRDVFARGPRRIPVLTRPARLSAQRLTLTVPRRLTTLKFNIPMGEATLNEAFYGPALDTLGARVASIGELFADAAPGTAPPPEEMLGLLVAGTQVRSVPGTADPEAVARMRCFNRTRLTINTEDGQHAGWIAGTAIGSAISVGLVEMLVYEAVAAHEDAGTSPSTEEVIFGVHALLATRGMSLKADDPEAAKNLAAEVRTIFEEWGPIWRRLGAL